MHSLKIVWSCRTVRPLCNQRSVKYDTEIIPSNMHGSIFEVDPAFRYCESGIELTQFLANGDVPCEQSFLCGLAFSISEVLFLAVSRVFG